MSTSPCEVDLRLLRELASDSVVRLGTRMFRQRRVEHLEDTPLGVLGLVQVDESRTPVEVEIDQARGRPRARCSCDFYWEPVCPHAIAVLLAWEATQPLGEAAFDNPRADAIRSRKWRGRTQVAVVSRPTTGLVGTWRAESVAHRRPTAASYPVDIVGDVGNRCACMDFRTNALGTCKHIEAVLHHIAEEAAGRSPVIAAPRLAAVDSTTRARPRKTARAGELEAALRADILDNDRHVGGVSAKLHPYQVDGVAFLVSRGRALLADDMGLGKTVQALAAFAELRRNDDIRRALVVCPASLKHQWARETRRFTDLVPYVVSGGPRARARAYRARADLTIVNYELVRRDWAMINELLEPELVVLDEAQRIRNWQTQTADAVKGIRSRFAFALTGTPLENKLLDLYSVIQFVDPHLLEPLWKFHPRFHLTGINDETLAYRNLGALRGSIAPLMLRRAKTEVLDELPERIDSTVEVTLTIEQCRYQDGALADIAMILSKADKERRELTWAEEKMIMALLQRLRMVCTSMSLVRDDVPHTSPKLDALSELLGQIRVRAETKVVVFTEWKRIAEEVVRRARALDLNPVYLCGEVPTSRRGRLIERFDTDPDCRVFVSTDAGGVGLNLQVASVVINMDLPWNPAVLEQRIGRVHRMGQAQPVQVFQVLARGSFEARVAEKLAAKRELFDNVIGPGDSPTVAMGALRGFYLDAVRSGDS